MEELQPLNLMNTMTSEKIPPEFTIKGTPYASGTRSSESEKQGFKPQLHSLHTVKAVLKLEKCSF